MGGVCHLRSQSEISASKATDSLWFVSTIHHNISTKSDSDILQVHLACYSTFDTPSMVSKQLCEREPHNYLPKMAGGTLITEFQFIT